MLIDSHNFRRVILAAGKTDLRKGIDGLAALVKSRFDLDPFESDVLFLFCGTSKRKIKGLLWEGDGFLLLYKRAENGLLHPMPSASAEKQRRWKPWDS